jgi:cell division protein FtsI/penicillin-binding protein 2
VLAKSSNVGVIKAALLIGNERLYRTIRGFGFGQATGIDLPGESAGILHPLERWGFGQGISVTPLQLAAAAGAVAGEGELLRPHVVAAVSRGEARVARHAKPPVAGRPISAATARQLQALLEGVVTGGTGRNAAVAGYRVAGKTGTAQIPVRGGYLRNSYLPSFVGFAPAGRPVLVGVVAIAEPRGFEYHGGQVAAPVFGAIARQVLLYQGVHPERERPAFWPGQPGQMVMAGLPAAPPAPAAFGDDDVPTDGDERGLEAGPDPVLWRGPAPPGTGPPAAGETGEAGAESDRSSAEGGRSHAPF